MRAISLFVVSAVVLISSLAVAENYTGTYVLNESGVTITLVMRQDAKGGITGTLTSSAGGQFQLEGKLSEGAAIGVAKAGDSGVFFEAHLVGEGLELQLIPVDNNNMPDYNSAKQLMLTRQGGGSPPISSQPPKKSPPKKSPPASCPPPQTEPSAPASSAATGQELSDPAWGFKFRVPAGWVYKTSGDGAIIGHNSIAGVILVIPHQLGSLQEVRQQMQQGLQEEGVQLSLEGALQSMGKNALVGNYSGFYNGQPVKARSIGTFGPSGGGAFVIALCTPDNFSRELSSAADSIASGMQYPKASAQGAAGGAGGGNLMAFFAGKWSRISANSTSTFTLSADGQYSEYSESSYSGNFTNQYGNQTGSWGAGGQNQRRGRCTVRGTRESGVMTVTFEDGTQESYKYKVHVENGKTYWNEYYIGGQLYGKN